MKNVLIDTNVILDFLMKREGFFEDARNVLALGYNKCYTLHLSSLSFSNIAYIARKNILVMHYMNASLRLGSWLMFHL